MPLIWFNAAVRDAHMTVENERRYQERHQEAEEAGGDPDRSIVPADALERAQGDPGSPARAMPGSPGQPDRSQPEAPILDSADADMAGALAFSEASRKGRSRVRGRAGVNGQSSSPDGLTTNYIIPKSEINEIADTCTRLNDPKEGWRLLPGYLRRTYGLNAKQADELRPVIWAKRAELLKAEKAKARAARKAAHAQGKAVQASGATSGAPGGPAAG